MDACSLHAPPDVENSLLQVCPSFLCLFLLCYLSPSPLFAPPSLRRGLFSPCPRPFSDIWRSCRLFRSLGFDFAVLYLLLSFLKVNCSLRYCFSACERAEGPADYLAVKMIKVAEHLRLFTPAACMSALAPEACVRIRCARRDHSAPCV